MAMLKQLIYTNIFNILGQLTSFDGTGIEVKDNIPSWSTTLALTLLKRERTAKQSRLQKSNLASQQARELPDCKAFKFSGEL